MGGVIRYVSIWLALLLCAPASRVLAWEPVFPTQHQAHLWLALDALNLTSNDLGFKKDYGKPRLALKRVRGLMHNPLDAPVLADEMIAAYARYDTSTIWYALPATLLELDDKAEPAEVLPLEADQDLPAPLRDFVARAAIAQFWADRALAGLSEDARAYLAGSVLGGAFGLDVNVTTRLAVVAMGVSSGVVERIIAENVELDPGPTASNYLSHIESVDLASLLKGAEAFNAALDTLQASAADMAWPDRPRKYVTPLGAIWVGSTRADRYVESSCLIIDPGGDDIYTGAAGSVNGLTGARLAAILDLAGEDRYIGSSMLGPGAALLGIAYVVDASGNDFYSAEYTGQGVGLFGASLVDDRDGDDVYRAHGFAQGAAYVGVGVLRDVSGHDLYDVGFSGQAYAGVASLGVLWDGQGNDRYTAGGRKHDTDRHDQRYLSMAQGFAIGMRPFSGGGIAALIDMQGNDAYVADVFGQGASYWYAFGALLDLGGHDTYTIYHYGQGSGIHLSTGLLADGGGDDYYTGYSLVQGNAHDYAVGMLFDHSGNDQYAADEHAQGRGFFNAFGLLVDALGNDSYLARQPQLCQGIGHDGHYREYGALGVLLDLKGHDVYAIENADGEMTRRPFYGVIYDLK